MRKNDHNDSMYFRSGDRVFCLNGKWYYQTRESDHGPFYSREAAELDMQRYVDEMRFFDGANPDRDPATVKKQDFADFQLIDKDAP